MANENVVSLDIYNELEVKLTEVAKERDVYKQ